MRELYNVIEGILGSDDKVTQDLIGEEATAKLHYQLFMNYVGDLLYSETFYQNFSGEINFLIKDQKSYISEVYKQFDTALNKYFRELQRIHKDEKISWNKSTELGATVYKLTLINKKSNEEQTATFKVVSRRDHRLVRVITSKNKPFMLP